MADVTGGEVASRPNLSFPAQAANPVARSYRLGYLAARRIPASRPGRAITRSWERIKNENKTPGTAAGGLQVNRTYL